MRGYLVIVRRSNPEDQPVTREAPLGRFIAQSSIWPPKLVSDQSAWNEHIPFAGWIVEATRPNRIVELGTHAGVSYFAFCEAVSQLGLPTDCFAVDHWKGDEHAGFYGEQIYEGVKLLNDQHFSQFSSLIRSSFEDALAQFTDRSIDLLHIDGLHTYEAVKHDVESWLPKLSSRGVLLMHDTNEHKGDFGVYRVLAELSEDWPVFEFTHGHGLGVVAVGSDVPPLVAELTALRGREREAVRDLYQALGRRFAQEIELGQLDAKFTGTRHTLEQARLELIKASARGEELEKGRDRARARNVQATADIAMLRTLTSQARETEAKAIARQGALERQLSEMRAALHTSRASAKQAQAALKRERKTRKDLARKLERLRSRRVVRLALSLAGLARPLFRWRRRPTTAAELEPAEATEALDGRTDLAPEPASIRVEAPIPPSRTVEAGLRVLQRLQEPLADGLLIGGPQPVDVIVPIFNAPDSLRRCLGALVANTSGPARVLLMNDASTDPAVSEILSEYQGLPGIEVIENDGNLGFTRTVNRGFSMTENDVVILNSDVEVTPGWLDRMRLTSRLNPRAATVTPVSNNAGAFSVPELGVANLTPGRLDRDQVGRLIRNEVGHQLARAPTGNGFCMFVRRDALDEIGYFDEEAFPRGYGEENDWCMRAIRVGWENIVDGSVFVFHERSASFGDEKHALMEKGRQILDERYPDYTQRVRDFVSSSEMESIRSSAATAFDLVERTNVDPRPRVLYVLHSGGGGTSATSADLMEELDDRYETFLLNSDGSSITLSQGGVGELEKIESWRLNTPITPNDEHHAEYRSLVARLLVELGIDLIHIRHLIGHSFDMAGLAKELGIPVVLSFHDYYYICPTVHLLDNKDRFCGGTCTPGQGNCRIPTSWLSTVPYLKHSWVYQWQDRVRRLFADVDVFVTASDAARSAYLDSYPELADTDFRVIEHGRDFSEWDGGQREPEISADRVRIVIPGNLTVHKGSNLIRDMKAHDPDDLLEFHFLGTIPESLHHLGIHHGTYSREDLAHRIAEIRPAMVGVLSVTAETYSHVVSESWALGIPVLTTDLGAPAERVERHGGGWVIPHDDPGRAVELVTGVAADPDEWLRQRQLANLSSVRTLGEMSTDYAMLYEEVWNRRKAFASGWSASLLRADLALVGHRGEHPGSVYVRSLTRWSHPELRSRMVASSMDVAHFLAQDSPQPPDLVYVQRTAIPADLVDALIARCSDLGSGLVVDIDDDIINLGPDSPAYADYRDQIEPMKRLLMQADLVTVSTPTLAATLSELARRVEVVPNRLDERLWARPLADSREDQHPFRVLYYGTRTHSEDLAILRPVMESVAGDIELHVVGVEEPEESQTWYRRVEVPIGASRYPAFVAWLQEIKGEFDAAVIPLVDNSFNRSKSDLKYLETAALGLPGVFSDVVPYADSVRDGISGLLVPNDTDRWVSALVTLASDRDLREGIRRAAYSQVMEYEMLGSQMPGYVEMLGDVVKGRHTGAGERGSTLPT